MFVPFSRVFWPSWKFGFYSKIGGGGGGETVNQSRQTGCFSQFFKGTPISNDFSKKKCGYFD